MSLQITLIQLYISRRKVIPGKGQIEDIRLKEKNY